MYKYAKKIFNGGDPFILKHKDMYYIYCTTDNELPAFTDEYPFFETYKNGMDGIEVYTSADLIHWENKGYCLKKEASVGEHGFWAPEVSYYNGRFYMIYSVDERLAIAAADTPMGPFEKHTPSYLMDKRAIDGHLFFDDDGKIYLYYADLTVSNRIMCAEMAADLKTVSKEYNNALISAECPWETIEGRIAEGPFVLKHNETYYLTYSANHTRNPNYGMGYAVSKSPTGPFEKYIGNPILHKFDDIVGTGHHSFMPTDDKDKYICVYHCHGGNISGFKPRMICLAEARFVKNVLSDAYEIQIEQ